MKKLLCLILTVTLLMIIGSTSFAATTIPDDKVPGAPTVDSSTYDEPETVIDDEDTPEGVPEVPLPKTGGIPAEAFYVAGALIIVAALILSRKKTASSKN